MVGGLFGWGKVFAGREEAGTLVQMRGDCLYVARCRGSFCSLRAGVFGVLDMDPFSGC